MVKCERDRGSKVIIYGSQPDEIQISIQLWHIFRSSISIGSEGSAISNHDKHIEQLIAKAGNTNIGKVTNHITINAFNKTSFTINRQ